MLRARFKTKVFVPTNDGMKETTVEGTGTIVEFATKFDAMVKGDDGHTYAVNVGDLSNEEKHDPVHES